MRNEHRHPDPVQAFSQLVEEAWPLTLDSSPRAIHVSSATARGEGRVRGHSNSIVSGSLEQWTMCNPTKAGRTKTRFSCEFSPFHPAIPAYCLPHDIDR